MSDLRLCASAGDERGNVLPRPVIRGWVEAGHVAHEVIQIHRIERRRPIALLEVWRGKEEEGGKGQGRKEQREGEYVHEEGEGGGGEEVGEEGEAERSSD